PGISSKTCSMLQKQPPAKIAAAIPGGGAGAGRVSAPTRDTNAINATARKRDAYDLTSSLLTSTHLQRSANTCGEASSTVGEASSTVSEASSTVSEASSTVGEACSTVSEASSTVGEVSRTVSEASSTVGEASSTVGEACSTVGE